MDSWSFVVGVLGVDYSVRAGKKRPELSFLKIDIALDGYDEPLMLETTVYECLFFGWPGTLGERARKKWRVWAKNPESLVPFDAGAACYAAERGALKTPELVRVVESGDFLRLDAIRWKREQVWEPEGAASIPDLDDPAYDDEIPF